MNTCGSILQTWRKKRRYSQLELALEAGLSSKHLSFIETGRSTPSRNMILKLDQFLSLPRCELNRALHLAGYAQKYTELIENHKDMKPVFSALDRIISNQLPYPAFVLDRRWNVVRSNKAMGYLLSNLGMTKHNNIIDALTDVEFDKSQIENYTEVISQLLIRLKSEIALSADDEKLETLEKNLTNALPVEGLLESTSPVLSTIFNIEGKKLSLFSTIVELGTVQDVSIGKFKIELMFPLNQETEIYFKEVEDFSHKCATPIHAANAISI